MGFDAESQKTLDEVVDRLNLIGADLIAKAQAALQKVGEDLIDRARATGDEFLTNAALEVHDTIEALDGWTVSIIIPPISIPPIRIRLNAPPTPSPPIVPGH